MIVQLAPDIEAGIRAEAAARGVDVDTLIATAVQEYVREAAAPVLLPEPSGGRSAELAWAARPAPEYFGKWVVLEGDEVAASGSDPKRLYEDARAQGCSSPFLIFVSRREDSAQAEPFAGGWLD
jgi:hypothetical protein